MDTKVSVGPVDTVILVPIEKIRPNPDQPRIEFDHTELHALRVSMLVEGQLVPVFLKPVTDEYAKRDGVEYELVDGERRWQAAMLEASGITHLKAIVREYDSLEQYRKACAVNFNRLGHTPYEEIYMCWTLVKVHKHSLNYVSSLLGKSVIWVSQRVLAYERLAPDVMAQVQKGKVPISVATKLAKLIHTDQRKELDRYLNGGGTITDVMIAVRNATDAGRVQGGIRQPDKKDDRKYILRSADDMLTRFKRHRAMGDERLRAVVATVTESERTVLIQKLGEAGREIVNLMRLLKSEDL
jgi:ParB family transcriptional regulator, chromosome partitioning protein